MYSIGADIGGSHISVCLFEHSNKQVVAGSTIHRKINRLAAADEILSGWANALSEVIVAGNRPVQGVGLAMPGPFDYYHGISKIKGVDKFESLYGMDIRTELANRLSIVPGQIRFINDASAFTIAESFLGTASRFSRCAGITLGTGMGSSFAENGKPVINRTDVPSGGVLFDKLFNGTPADDVFSTRGLIRSYFVRSGKTCNSVLQISEKSQRDPVARETFLAFGQQLGSFLKPWLEKFNAECLVLGGNIVKAWPLFQEPLQNELKGLTLYVSSRGEEAAMIGAARLLDEDYYTGILDALRDM